MYYSTRSTTFPVESRAPSMPRQGPWRSRDGEPLMTHLTYLEAGVVGLVQGISEMFPVSSLGHNVLIPALIGGSWARDLNVAAAESPYLAFIVGLHVATAIALLIYFWRDWIRIIGGFFSSIRYGKFETTDQKLAWMIILATIPVGLVGVVFEHEFRVLFGVPIRAAIFLIVNGVILLAGEKFRTRASRRADAAVAAADGLTPSGGADAADPEAVAAGAVAAGAVASRARAAPPGTAQHASGHRAERQAEIARAISADTRLAGIGYGRTVLIGTAQILALRSEE